MSDEDGGRQAVLDRLGSERRGVLRGAAGLAGAVGLSGAAGGATGSAVDTAAGDSVGNAAGDPVSNAAGDPVSNAAGVSLDGWDPATVAETYDRETAVQAVLSAGVLEQLTEAGVLPASSATAERLRELPYEAVDFLGRTGPISPLAMDRIEATDGRIVVTATIVDDRATPQVYVALPVEVGTLLVSVVPEAETGVADLITASGSERLVTSPIQFATECAPYDNLCYCCVNLDCSECSDCTKL